MCVIAIAWEAHPRWRLVVAANRDENHDRLAEPLHRWADDNLIAGRDLTGRGTWLAVSEEGRFAAVTNLRGYGAPRLEQKSRGELVTNLALGRGDYRGTNRNRLKDFGPFQAVAITGGDATFLSNRPEVASRRLAPGLHILSNGPINEPCPKSNRLFSIVETWLGQNSPARSDLFEALRDRHAHAETACGSDSLFVADPIYGTRCSTVVTVDRTGEGVIDEIRYDRAGEMTGTGSISFHWPL